MSWRPTRCSSRSTAWTACTTPIPGSTPNAVRFTSLTYDEAIAADIKIMDTSAFVLANEQALTMHVFDVGAIGVMKSICEGADFGTRITAK